MYLQHWEACRWHVVQCIRQQLRPQPPPPLRRRLPRPTSTLRPRCSGSRRRTTNSTQTDQPTAVNLGTVTGKRRIGTTDMVSTAGVLSILQPFLPRTHAKRHEFRGNLSTSASSEWRASYPSSLWTAVCWYRYFYHFRFFFFEPQNKWNPFLG